MNEDRILQQLAYIKEKLDSIVAALGGDPSDETKPGLFLRVDRLEQSKKAHNRILWTIISGGMLTTGTVAAALLVKYLI